MPTESTAADVFEAVEADPDAILEECDAATPTELVESGGKHEPDLEAEIDDVTAAELFADLEDDVANATDDSADANRDTGTGETRRTDAVADESAPVADLEFEFVGDADVTVRDDGDVVDATAAELDALTAPDPNSNGASDADGDGDGGGPAASDDTAETAPATDSDSSDATASGTLTITTEPTDELELVGPAPPTTRVTNDTFGSAPSDAAGSPPTDAR